MKPVMEEFQAELERKWTGLIYFQIDCLKTSSNEFILYKINNSHKVIDKLKKIAKTIGYFFYYGNSLNILLVINSVSTTSSRKTKHR
jgi:hypothetical protein